MCGVGDERDQTPSSPKQGWPLSHLLILLLSSILNQITLSPSSLFTTLAQNRPLYALGSSGIVLFALNVVFHLELGEGS